MVSGLGNSPRIPPKAALLTGAILGLAACGGHASPGALRRPLLAELHKLPGPKTQAGPVSALPADATKVSFARIAKYPEPGWNVPRSAQHAPLGPDKKQLVTFLASERGDETMSLFAFDLATGKSDVLFRAADLGTGEAARSRDEELRRERQRDRNEGITQYVWAKHAKVLVVPHRGDIFVRDYAREPAGVVRRLTKTPEPEIDPKPCDTGERVAFVRGGELYSIDVASGKETALTSRGANKDGVTHGLSDFVAQEELGEPSGFFWSPKCDRIAYLEVDERPVDMIPVLGYRGAADLMMQRYPRAGTKNPRVRAAVVDLKTKRSVSFDFKGDAAERYLGRFHWADDGQSLYVQSLSRDQKELTLLKVDPRTGAIAELARERSPAWVSFSPLRVLPGSGDLVFTSTKSGHRHLELRSGKDGSLIRALTSGPWDVEGVAGIARQADDEMLSVLFTATKESPLERQLYRVDLAGNVTRLTTERGVHRITADESGTTWLDVHSATNRPPKAVVMSEGHPIGALPIAPDPDMTELGLRPVEHVTLRAADGEPLHATLIKPRVIRGKHPAIVMVYGGPESQLIFDSWAPRLLWQHLADRGFVVFQLDNRGTGGRGALAAQKVHKRLGVLELEDQVAGAKWLATQPFVDGTRIGIYGHSYGGFMAALAMLDGKGVFRAGVAGSPVTDWRLYDTGYTERYMETPQTNPEGYEASDLSKKASGLTGHLLITHAMMDENVHYAHTAKLVDALIAADKPFDLLVLPGERHGLRAPAARAYMPERVVDYFVTHLGTPHP